mmetsp:Transcript_20905/g.64591  ORF Transcript_20905/g.64591 Transcript_20905/m.64591 type:complete len:271 (+) Transcript_20905:320-1132(+)
MRYGEAPGSRRGGPKGQLAQYKYFKEMQYRERLAKKAARKALWYRGATGSTRLPGAPEPEAEAKTQHRDDSSDDSDSEALRAYRQRRLEELRVSSGKPRFGEMRREVTKEAYLAAISVDARVVVCVHLHEPTYPACRRLEAILVQLARRRPDLSFVSMTLDEAEQAFEPALLPLLVLYRNTDVVDTLFRVTDDLDPLDELNQLEDILDASSNARGADEASYDLRADSSSLASTTVAAVPPKSSFRSPSSFLRRSRAAADDVDDDDDDLSS